MHKTVRFTYKAIVSIYLYSKLNVRFVKGRRALWLIKLGKEIKCVWCKCLVKCSFNTRVFYGQVLINVMVYKDVGFEIRNRTALTNQILFGKFYFRFHINNMGGNKEIYAWGYTSAIRSLYNRILCGIWFFKQLQPLVVDAYRKQSQHYKEFRVPKLIISYLWYSRFPLYLFFVNKFSTIFLFVHIYWLSLKMIIYCIAEVQSKQAVWVFAYSTHSFQPHKQYTRRRSLFWKFI